LHAGVTYICDIFDRQFPFNVELHQIKEAGKRISGSLFAVAFDVDVRNARLLLVVSKVQATVPVTVAIDGTSPSSEKPTNLDGPSIKVGYRRKRGPMPAIKSPIEFGMQRIGPPFCAKDFEECGWQGSQVFFR
jgi:hypothetical protein